MSAGTINPFRLFTGAMVPVWLLERSELSPGAKLCYARLARYAGPRGVAFPRLDTLGRDLGVSRDQAKRYIRELVRCRLIRAERGGFHRANRYAFLSHPWITEQPARQGINAPSRRGISAPSSPGAIQGRARAVVLESQEKGVTGRAGALPPGAGAAPRRGPSARRIQRLVKTVVGGL